MSVIWLVDGYGSTTENATEKPFPKVPIPEESETASLAQGFASLKPEVILVNESDVTAWILAEKIKEIHPGCRLCTDFELHKPDQTFYFIWGAAQGLGVIDDICQTFLQAAKTGSDFTIVLDESSEEGAARSHEIFIHLSDNTWGEYTRLSGPLFLSTQQLAIQLMKGGSKSKNEAWKKAEQTTVGDLLSRGLQ